MLTFSTLLQALAALAATLGLMVIALWLWQRFGKALTPSRPQANAITILTQTRLSPTTTLHVVEANGHHLIATTAAQTTLIHTYSPLPKISKPTSKKAKIHP